MIKGSSKKGIPKENKWNCKWKICKRKISFSPPTNPLSPPSTFFFEITINFEDSTIGGNLSKETRSFVSRSYTADNRAENDKGFFRGYPILTSFTVNTYKNKSVGFFHTPSFFQPNSFLRINPHCLQNTRTLLFLPSLGCEKKLSKTYLIFHCVVAAVSTPLW